MWIIIWKRKIYLLWEGTLRDKRWCWKHRTRITERSCIILGWEWFLCNLQSAYKFLVSHVQVAYFHIDYETLRSILKYLHEQCIYNRALINSSYTTLCKHEACKCLCIRVSESGVQWHLCKPCKTIYV